MNGWIKIHKKFLEWRWYSEPNTKIVFLHLLLTANFERKEWKNTYIERGQVVTGINSLSETLGLSVQQVRTALDKLVSTGEINKQITNKFSIITICNYDKYQCLENEEQQQDNKQITSQQQANNKQITTTKEYKNIRNKEYIKEDIDKSISKKSKAEREIDFRNKVAEVANGTYPQDMIDKFCDYWTESNESEKAKLRYEKEKVFDITRRLNTWQNRSYGTNGNKHHTTDAEYKRQTAEAVRIASEFYAKGGSPF